LPVEGLSPLFEKPISNQQVTKKEVGVKKIKNKNKKLPVEENVIMGEFNLFSFFVFETASQKREQT